MLYVLHLFVWIAPEKWGAVPSSNTGWVVSEWDPNPYHWLHRRLVLWLVWHWYMLNTENTVEQSLEKDRGCIVIGCPHTMQWPANISGSCKRRFLYLNMQWTDSSIVWWWYNVPNHLTAELLNTDLRTISYGMICRLCMLLHLNQELRVLRPRYIARAVRKRDCSISARSELWSPAEHDNF